jgi:radical SAM superfamily enzyme YgiQ (UPF0313 family)
LIEAIRARAGWEKVHDLVYRDPATGRAIFTDPAPVLQDLDRDMPGVAWDLLPMKKYRAHNWHCFGGLPREPYAALYTTLGCPFHCSFCCIQAPFKRGERAAGMAPRVNSYRMWSVERVLEEIDTLVARYGVRNIKIADEMFVLNPKHVLGICEGVRRRGYDLNFWAYARLDTVRDEWLEPLRAGGVRWLAFGIEAASERVLEAASKGIRQDQIPETLARVRRAGIFVIGNYIFGLPEDDRQSMRETLDLACELNSEFVNFYCAMAYPGSALYEEAVRAGLPVSGDWSSYSQHSENCRPVGTRRLPPEEVVRFRDEAFHEYFSRPAYLNLIRDTFGEETVEEIRRMSAERLQRKPAGC